MKTLPTILMLLAFAIPVQAQSPQVSLSLEVTGPDTGKTWYSALITPDDIIPTGGGSSVFTGILIEDLDVVEDDHVKVKLMVVDRITRLPYTGVLEHYEVTIRFGVFLNVLSLPPLPTATDLSGLGICNEFKFSTTWRPNQYRVGSCAGLSNGTGELFEITLDVDHDLLANFADPEFLGMIGALQGIGGEDLMNGCPNCAATAFTTTHYGIDSSVFGYGNGPKMKADSATMQGLLSITCDPLFEIACTDPTGAVSCRQPHVCNTWGDVNGDNMVDSNDVNVLFAYDLFNVPLDIGPDDNKFSPYDPSPFSP